MRVPLSPCSEFGAGPRLPAVLERASLALLVLVPYVGDKVEAVVERWTRDDDDGRLGKVRTRCRFYVRLHLLSVLNSLSCFGLNGGEGLGRLKFWCLIVGNAFAALGYFSSIEMFTGSSYHFCSRECLIETSFLFF